MTDTGDDILAFWLDRQCDGEDAHDEIERILSADLGGES